MRRAVASNGGVVLRRAQMKLGLYGSVCICQMSVILRRGGRYLHTGIPYVFAACRAAGDNYLPSEASPLLPPTPRRRSSKEWCNQRKEGGRDVGFYSYLQRSSLLPEVGQLARLVAFHRYSGLMMSSWKATFKSEPFSNPFSVCTCPGEKKGPFQTTLNLAMLNRAIEGGTWVPNEEVNRVQETTPPGRGFGT